MRKIIFLDRDGTIIDEPVPSKQIDSLEKFIFLPNVISALKAITKAGYELVMVTNQDGLGTDSFPEETFWPYQDLMTRVLKAEGIEFSDVLIDRSFQEENKDTRKPGTGLLTEYVNLNYDKKNSYVIGDRHTDVLLAKNLGCKSIFYGVGNPEADISSADWQEIASSLTRLNRAATVRRETKETNITVAINLEGSGKADIKTGLGFFDHMLEQVAYHGMFDLEIKCTGDLHIDEHHTIEDVALSLGSAVYNALGDKSGIYRYGFLLPMDEAEAKVSIDFSGRPWFVWNAEFKREKIGDMPTECFKHFFKSFSDAAYATLHMEVFGENEHHKIEALFKAFGRAMRFAIEKDPRREGVPSTKGVL